LAWRFCGFMLPYENKPFRDILVYPKGRIEVMSFQLNDQVIRMLCGQFSYEDGEAIYQDGKVTFTREAPETSIYEATIEGETTIQVSVDYSRKELDAICSCPVFHPDDQYCKHIAAVLMNIKEFGFMGGSPIDLPGRGKTWD
jgi:uncharacterized Zn finger protein